MQRLSTLGLSQKLNQQLTHLEGSGVKETTSGPMKILDDSEYLSSLTSSEEYTLSESGYDTQPETDDEGVYDAYKYGKGKGTDELSGSGADFLNVSLPVLPSAPSPKPKLPPVPLKVNNKRNTPKVGSGRPAKSLPPIPDMTSPAPPDVMLTSSTPIIPLPPLPAGISSSPTKLMSFIPSLVARHYHRNPKLNCPPMVEHFYG